MDEYSQAYKDFMRGAEALQALWEPGVGDWHLTQYGKVDLIRNNLDIACRRPEWLWLPSLFQLIRVIEGRWPFIQIGGRPTGDEVWPRVHIWAAAECVDWDPDGCGFWRCEECGDDLHEQDDGAVTCGSFPEDITDEAVDEWDHGSKLPVCPHCGWSEGKDLMLAAAQLAARAVEGKG